MHSSQILACWLRDISIIQILSVVGREDNIMRRNTVFPRFDFGYYITANYGRRKEENFRKYI